MGECLIHSPVLVPGPAVPAALLARLGALPTPALSDSMSRLPGARGLVPLTGEAKVVGSALTVRTRPGDNLVVHKAVDLARPGDVLVIDAGGEVGRAIIGDLLCRHAASRGIAGIVLDGAARDTCEIAAIGLPVFARGVTHLGPYKDGPGEIGGPVAVGGLPVHTGDLVVGDENGVLALPAARAEQIAEAAEALLRREADIVAAIEGDGWDRSWVDGALDITWIKPEESR